MRTRTRLSKCLEAHGPVRSNKAPFFPPRSAPRPKRLQRNGRGSDQEIKRTTKQKMARRHNKEGGNHLEQESNRQRTIEDIGGGLHHAVDGQSLGER